MIPKIIHWCWLSGDKYPPIVKKCIKSWKKFLPDYEIRLWDANSFNFNSIPFVREAFENKQWAFVSDYIRLYSIYKYGGIYLDSDVLILSNFDEWLKYDFFTGIETRPTECLIEAAILGSVANNPMIKEIMKYYERTSFLNSDGSFNRITAPDIMTPIIKKHLEWHQKDKTVVLANNSIIFGKDYICNSNFTLHKGIKLYHMNNQSWFPQDERRGIIYNYCLRNNLSYYYRIIERVNLKIRNFLNKKCY